MGKSKKVVIVCIIIVLIFILASSCIIIRNNNNNEIKEINDMGLVTEAENLEKLKEYKYTSKEFDMVQFGDSRETIENDFGKPLEYVGYSDDQEVYMFEDNKIKYFFWFKDDQLIATNITDK